jgi:hypothetical protein
MKRPQPDINKIAVDTFIAKTGGNKKLKRLWGTTVVNGVEVLNARRHYYKPADRPANSDKLFKFLKVDKDVDEYEGKGIKSAWFTLNKSNGPENLDVSANYIADNLNSMWWDNNDGLMPDDITLTTTIAIGRRFIFDSSNTFLLDTSLPLEEQVLYIESNYESIWNSNRIEQEGVGIINKGSVFNSELQINEPDEDDLSPDDPWLSIVSRYALRNSGIACTIKDIEVGLGDNGNYLYNTAVVTLEIPYQEFLPGDPIVQKILNDLDEVSFPRYASRYGRRSFINFIGSNEQTTQASAKQVNYYETENDLDVSTISRSYIQWENATIQASVYENFWLQDGDVWYFKADVINNPKAYGTTHVKLNTYLFSLLDTGYKKKKVSWWKKLVALIIFIVVVVLTFLYPPAGIIANSVAAAATAVLAGSLVVSLVIFALSALSETEWAMAFAWVSKETAPLVTVASIVLVVTALYNQAVQAGTEAAADSLASGAGQEAASTAANEAIKESITTTILDSITNAFVGTSASSIIAGSLSTTQIISVSNRVVLAYTNLQVKKLENISSKNKDLKVEYEKLVEETSRESDIMRGYMNVYAKPATADWSIYSSTYDLPYERGGGILSTGNIQKTTKQAMRKPDYNEPMFESLNFV